MSAPTPHRPKILDALGDELLRAARADEARHARHARRRPRPARSLPRATVIGLATLLLLAAVAVAATLVIGRGDPIPAPPPGAVPRELQPADGTARLNGLDVADPDGGPAWDVRTSRSRTGGAICATVGQVLDGDLGIVGLDHKFHALPAGAADTCSTPQKAGATLAGARALRGGDGLRAITVVSGVVAPGVARATATAAGSEATNLKLGPAGAFLAIFEGTPERLRPRVDLTEADGRVTTLRFADTGEYLTEDPSGGAPWTLHRATHRVAPGLRCIAAQRERGPDSPQPLPRSAGLFAFQTASTPPRCARDGTAFAAVQRFAPIQRNSWSDYYWGINVARTMVWGAAPRAGAAVTVSAPGVAERHVAVDPETLGFAAALDGHVDPGAVKLTVDGRPLAVGAGVVDRRARPVPTPPVPAWRSIAAAIAAAPKFTGWAPDRRTLRTVRRAPDPAGGPDWSLRTWIAHIPASQRVGPGMSRELRCFQVGVAKDGKLTLPLPGGGARTLGLGESDVFCNDVHYLATHTAGPLVRTDVDDPAAADPRPTHVVVAGLLGPGVRAAQLLGAGAPRRLALARDGTFLVVLPAAEAAKALRVRMTRADGRTATSRTDGLEEPCRLTVAGSVRVADPDGGAPWAAGTSHVGEKQCSYISQVVGGHLAWVDQDAGTVRFGPGSFSSGVGVRRTAAVSVQVQGPNGPDQPGEDPTSPAQVVRRTLPGRTFVSGHARADVVSITLRTPRDVRTIKPGGGTYLAVYDGTFYGGEIVATAHLRDGRDVTVRQPAAFLAPTS